jgi:maleate isomerase
MMKRIGLLLPSSNTTMEPEFYAMAPENITIHTTRMLLQDVTISSLEKMAEDAANAAELLSTANVDLIVYGCTSGSLLKGLKWEEKLVNKIQKETGVPTITTARAVVKALKEIRASKISVLTPYIDEINRLEKLFLEAHGFHITNIKGLGLKDNLRIGNVSYEDITRIFDISSYSDCLFISCTNLSVVKFIPELESKYNIPVITSNQASMWLVLRSVYNKSIEGYGRLLTLLGQS